MYKLCSELVGHTLDVRGVAHIGEGQILSCSRDMTARLWESEGNDYAVKNLFQGRNEFVASICYVLPSENFPSGLVATGGNDSVVMCYSPDTGEHLFSLRGHKETVCCLAPVCYSNSHLLSSSWDKSAICWDLNSQQVLFTLTGHTQAIWCIIQLESGHILTGSGDKSIRCYTSSGVYSSTLVEGHTDCVRAFCALSDYEFVSAGNDGRIITWKMPEGIKLHSLLASNSYVYSVAYIKPIDTIVCGGESKGILFYNRSNRVTSTLHVPTTSVWSITILPNTDIVVGCSDGVIRIYTKDYSRQAPESSKAENNICVPATSLPAPENKPCGKRELPDLNELSGPELLSIPARHIDDIRIIRQGFHAVMFSWNGVEWIEVGRKLGTYSKEECMNKKQKTYYSFSIDVEDGKPHLKLSMNMKDDPWDIANEFVITHRLPQQYIKQIVDFLLRNVKDDFINSGQPDKENKYFPLSQFIKFDKSSPAIMSKLEEFNSSIEENKRIESKLLNQLKMISERDCKDEEAVKALLHLLTWPDEYLLPVLDLARLCLRFSYANMMLTSSGLGEKLIDQLLACILDGSNTSITLMALRVLSNMLCHDSGVSCIVKKKDVIIKCITKINVPSNPSPAFQIALSTLILNLTTLSQGHTGLRHDCLACASKLMRSFNDKEAVLRILSAIGSLISYCGSSFIPQETLATILEHTQALNLPDSHAESCLLEILGILVQ